MEREEIETIFGRLQPGQSVYIRLQNRDLDGSQQKGTLMVVKVEGKLSVSTAMLYPNPAYDQIYIEMSGSTKVLVTLLSNTGEVMLVDIPVESGNSLDISGIASGIYTVIISDTESSRTESIRLVK
ncbi:MAG: T9SS type A sorting domain-containing protein [Saprospiraceae bacterium]